MRFFQLQCFVMLANTLNFTKAAKLMYITQPMLSRHISNLEKDLDIVLFERSKRKVKLTPAGVTLLEEVEKVFDFYNKGIMKAKKVEKGISGSLSIGFLREKIDDFLPKAVNNFQNKHPNIEIIMNEFNHAALLAALKSGIIDFGFTISLGLSNISNINFLTTSKNYNVCIVINEEHPFASNETINLKYLANEPFVMLDTEEVPWEYNLVFKLCREHGFSPIVSTRVKHVTSLLTLVACKMGISILPSSAQTYSSSRIRFIKIENTEINIHNVVAWKKTNLNPCLPYFINELNQLMIET